MHIYNYINIVKINQSVCLSVISWSNSSSTKEKSDSLYKIHKMSRLLVHWTFSQLILCLATTNSSGLSVYQLRHKS